MVHTLSQTVRPTRCAKKHLERAGIHSIVFRGPAARADGSPAVQGMVSVAKLSFHEIEGNYTDNLAKP